MNVRHLLVAALAILMPAIAYAGPGTTPLPEPETMALLGIGAVALVIARWTRKK